MASPNSSPQIVALADKISTAVAELQGLLSAQGVPSPSWAENNPECLPANVASLQDTVLDATAELHELLLEPFSLVFKFAAISNLVSMDAVCRFHIADMIPPGGQISFEEISQKSGLDEALVRHAMTLRVLREPKPGMVAHTKISNLGAREGWPAATKGFCLANNTDQSIYEVLSADPMRATLFAASMKSFDHNPGYAITEIPKLYDWTGLGDVLIADVGGSKGHVAIELAKSFESDKLLVQDMELVVKGAESGVPDHLKGRIEFKAHGLFDPQVVQADVYFFRMIFHNWADKYALKILQAQIPALRPGVKILIQDAVMPDPGQIPLWRERHIRAMDINMQGFFIARERNLQEWKALLAAADERFVLQRVIQQGRSSLAILEVVWGASGSAKA
ncbi:sterigmatocystin 8-O-methyltransferase [Hypoxylon rubiginosum]|uniref:Sterigmatocystin 8-O-methyltransferase n=1 Tax=Hypoxylon rubiginosum TaxID=110542 RepID=A0ACB9YHX4_9PEZI|nr:sterigmatocystin 8-O-methyltransferase [Hypoxylon rubiginosum]